jgi:hypothetical protein
MNSVISSFSPAGRGVAHRGRWRRPLILLLLAATSLAGSAGPAARAETPTTTEYKVKASYLFNFTQFVEWPPTAFTAASTPIVIGVLGDDDFGAFFDELIQGETVKNRPLAIKRSRSIEDLKSCQILFISKSEKARLGPILASVAKTSTLTVSEIDGFARRGGVINFFSEGKKIRFEINRDAAQHRGLKLSSQLLNLGKLVGPEPGKEKE